MVNMNQEEKKQFFLDIIVKNAVAQQHFERLEVSQAMQDDLKLLANDEISSDKLIERILQRHV